MAPKTQQPRRAVPLDHGPGERIQPDREFLLLAEGLESTASLCYSSDSFVLFGTEGIPSKRDVQEGDLLGPTLFALGIHGAISEERAEAAAINCPVDIAA